MREGLPWYEDNDNGPVQTKAWINWQICRCLKVECSKKLCLKCDEEVLEICQKVSVDELSEWQVDALD